MRIVELLALLRELLTTELRAFVDALPTALHDLRDALQATVDQCIAFFTGNAPPSRRRRLAKRESRLSRLSAASHLLDDNDHAAASPQAEREQEREMRALSLADLAYAHDLVDRVSQIEDLENDSERALAVAKDIDAYLEELTGVQQSPLASASALAADADAAVLIPVPATEDLSMDEETALSAVAECEETADAIADAPLSPASELSDWNEAIPRVPGVAQALTALHAPVWNTDWTTNAFAALHLASDTESDAPSSRSTVSSPGSVVSEGEAVVPLWIEAEANAEDEVDVKIEAASEVGQPEETQVTNETLAEKEEEETSAVASPPLSTASSTSSCSSRKLFNSGVSYRQLTQELASPTEEEEETASSAFYRAALQKLKQEREERARLRAEAEELTPLTPSRRGLALLRPMRVTPLMPQYEDHENDDTRLARQKKLDELRQRTTAFAIKIGQPLSARRLVNPAHGPQVA